MVPRNWFCIFSAETQPASELILQLSCGWMGSHFLPECRLANLGKHALPSCLWETWSSRRNRKSLSDKCVVVTPESHGSSRDATTTAPTVRQGARAFPWPHSDGTSKGLLPAWFKKKKKKSYSDNSLNRTHAANLDLFMDPISKCMICNSPKQESEPLCRDGEQWPQWAVMSESLSLHVWNPGRQYTVPN